MALAGKLFRGIAIAASKYGVRKLAYALGAPYGVGTALEGAADLCINVFEEICKSIGGGRGEVAGPGAAPTPLEPATQREVRAEIAEVAQATADQSQAEMATAIDEVAPNMPPDERAVLTSYAALLPERVRRTLRRPEDPTGRTLPASRQFHTALDLAEFLPPVPRFAAGQAPVYNRTLVRILGVGTFGEVWEARKTGLQDRRVALKFCIGDDTALMHEARLAQRLNHPGIVRLEEIHPRQGEVPLCLEYEFIDGCDLAAWYLAQPIPDDQRSTFATEIIADLADIVHAAHQHRADGGEPEPIVHRDLKPGNVLVPKRAQATRFKIADFGIGAWLRSADDALHATLVRTSSGRTTSYTRHALAAYTPRYAPDEQVAGDKADPRHDVYALGVIWYQLLRADFSLPAPRGAGWRRQLRQRGLPQALVNLLERCVDSDPAERVADAETLAFQIRAALAPTQSEPKQRPNGAATPTLATPVSAPSSPSPKREGADALMARAEVMLVESLIRDELKIETNAPLDAEALSRLTSLTLRDRRVTRAMLAWLARPDSGLKALKYLAFSDATIEKEAMAALARSETGLQALELLSFWDTNVGDNGVEMLARWDTGLKNLRDLSLRASDVTDAALAALAAPDTGLIALTELTLDRNDISDAGVTTLAAADSGITMLNELSLSNTKVTDVGAAALAAPGTSLKALSKLDLSDTQITDAGIAALAAPRAGLTALAHLDLSGTKITGKGLAALAAPESGLAKLTHLKLSKTQVTNDGLMALAAPASALANLSSLNLEGTQVGDVGVAALAAPQSALANLTSINLEETRVTDIGVMALAAPDSGLRALESLDLSRTRVSETGENAIKRRFPKISVRRSPPDPEPLPEFDYDLWNRINKK